MGPKTVSVYKSHDGANINIIQIFKFGQFAQGRLRGTCCDDRVILVFVNCLIVVH